MLGWGEKAMPGNHTDRTYQQELEQLRRRLLEMGGKVESALATSIRALTGRDSEIAAEVKRSDRDLNRLEVEIDETCRRLLALRQPAASDLRFVTAVIKIVTDLGRMGNLAVNIAERATDLSHAPRMRPFHDFLTLADLSRSQLGKALEAFVQGDPAKADEVLKGQRVLDALYRRVFNELLAFMVEDSRAIRRATSIMFAAKHLERFADHAANVAEAVIYMVQGVDVRSPAFSRRT